MYETEQYFRSMISFEQGGVPNELGELIEAHDRFNALRLSQIIEEVDWPTISKVDKDGAHAAWSIIQHAVFNPPLMKLGLEKMAAALKEKEVDGIDYAYLYDRFCAVASLQQQR